jgi:hypothetical protein
MHMLSHKGWPDEVPTRRAHAVHSDAVALAVRVGRLAELAIERPTVTPDDETIAAAVADLVQLRALTGEVLR